MSVWKLVRLQFKAPVHFGETGIGIEETSERIRSDTLFSAWITAYVRLSKRQEEIADLLQRFWKQPEKPPFRLSSTFLYRRVENRMVDYLPKPLLFPQNYPAGDSDLQFFKTYKKLHYLPLEVWQRWYQGEGFTESDRNELIAKTLGESKGNLEQAGTFSYGEGFKKGQLPKISVDRVTAATNLYHTGIVQFQWDGENEQNQSGLYFLIQFSEPDSLLEKKLQAALEWLGDEGLGGERSSGAGHFKFTWEPLCSAWKAVVEATNLASQEKIHHSLISLFWEYPLSSEMLKGSSYELQERGGWIASPFCGRQLRRKMVRMFAEGSVFPSIPQGKLANVTPSEFRTPEGGYKPHPIYRSGISMSLPIKLRNA